MAAGVTHRGSGHDLCRPRRRGRRRHHHPSRRAPRGRTQIGSGCEIHSGRADRGLHDRRRRGRPQLLRHHRLARRRRAPGSGRSPTSRPQSDVGEQAHVGNFVELKKTRSARGSKANHLAYLGDATIGDESTSAPAPSPATTTASQKHQTVIEDGAFIGSDSQLIAPVTHRQGRVRRGRHRRSRRTCRPARSASRRAQQVNIEGWVGSGRARIELAEDRGVTEFMCGIIGYIGHKAGRPRSSSTACAGSSTAATTRPAWRSCGTARSSCGAAPASCSKLEDVIAADPIDGDYGIGHTRWATHGRPTEENAHPHRDCTGRIVVVHNGIIENYLDLKRELQQRGSHVRHRDRHRDRRAPRRAGDDAATAWRTRCGGRCRSMRGLFALVLISADDPDKIVAVRNGPPDRRRPRRRRVLRRLRHPRHPQPHARRRVPRRRGDGRRHPRGRRRSPTSPGAPSRRRRSACPGIR